MILIKWKQQRPMHFFVVELWHGLTEFVIDDLSTVLWKVFEFVWHVPKTSFDATFSWSTCRYRAMAVAFLPLSFHKARITHSGIRTNLIRFGEAEKEGHILGGHWPWRLHGGIADVALMRTRFDCKKKNEYWIWISRLSSCYFNSQVFPFAWLKEI